MSSSEDAQSRVRRVRRGSLSIQKAPPNIAYARHTSTSSGVPLEATNADDGQQEDTTDAASNISRPSETYIISGSEYNMLARRYPKAEWAWIRDSEKGYVLARKDKNATKVSEGKYCFIVQSTEERRTLTESEMSTMVYRVTDIRELDKNFVDMVQMVEVNPPMILHNIEKRFQEDMIYTNIGTSMFL